MVLTKSGKGVDTPAVKKPTHSRTRNNTTRRQTQPHTHNQITNTTAIRQQQESKNMAHQQRQENKYQQDGDKADKIIAMMSAMAAPHKIFNGEGSIADWITGFRRHIATIPFIGEEQKCQLLFKSLKGPASELITEHYAETIPESVGRGI